MTARLLSLSDGHELAPFDASTPQLSQLIEHLSARAEGMPVAFSPDGTRVLTGAPDAARLWDTSGRLIGVLRNPADLDRAIDVSPTGGMHFSILAKAEFIDSGLYVRTNYDDGEHIWDSRSGREVRPSSRQRGSEGPAPIIGVRFDPDAMTVYDIATLRALFELSGEGYSSKSLSAGGAQLAVGSVDGAVRLYSMRPLIASMDELAQQICRQLPTHMRRFSLEDTFADPLISEVWFRNGRDDASDVCGGVAGVEELPPRLEYGD